MTKISKITAQIIHDSRGDETVQATVQTDDNFSGTSAVPAGISVGSYEAAVVVPTKSVEYIKAEIDKELRGIEVTNQEIIDQLLISLDGTANKSRLGGNTLLAVSLAASRAAAAALNIPLYRYIAQLDHREPSNLPIPMFNLINGGKHAENNLEFQEFMIIPDGIKNYQEQLSAGKLIFNVLGEFVRDIHPIIPIGDEGGYAPMLDSNEIALELLMKAVKNASYQLWDEVSIGLDIAASSLPATFEATTHRYLSLLKDFPILSLEDPFNEDDWQSWRKLKKGIEKSNLTNKSILLVGDDIFATNPSRLSLGVKENIANAIIIKPNQIGTISEALNVVQKAKMANYAIIASHRSGETLDDYLADFAVGIGAQFIKTGAPNENHPERMVKYRRLLAIEKNLRGNESN